MTPEDILHAEFPESALAELNEAIDGLPHATHALWGLSYWLKEHGDQMGSMMVQDWAHEFAEHEARRRRTRGAYTGRSAPVAASRASAPALNLGTCSLSDFARAVTHAAKTTRTGRWHGAVFISHVWSQLNDDHPAGIGITYDRFQRRLMEAFQDDLLELSRADLVEAMPHQDVADSELTHSGARFHFIRL